MVSFSSPSLFFRGDGKWLPSGRKWNERRRPEREFIFECKLRTANSFLIDLQDCQVKQ